MTGGSRIGPRVDSGLWNQFKNEVQRRRGSHYGYLREELENAIREYLHATEGGDIHDRLSRIEAKQDEILSMAGDTTSNEMDHTHTNSNLGPRQQDRIEKIYDRIEEKANGDNKVHESDVHNAIREVAGGNDTTLRTYKDGLKERHLAFEWPESSDWWLDGEKFVKVYTTTFTERYDQLKQTYGENWVEMKLNGHGEVADQIENVE